MESSKNAATIDEYIAAFPSKTRLLLEEMRALVHECAPGAVETMSYSMPTFDLNGRHLVYFAGYHEHVSLYPGKSSFQALGDELGPYKFAKATVRFAIDRPLPADLIRKIVRFRVAENEAKRGAS